MILEFFRNFENVEGILAITNYIFTIVGMALIVYVFGIFSVITFTLFKTKNLDTIKAIHITSVVEVYAFVCFIIGILMVFKFEALILPKFFLFILIVIFNGITATRLIAKTAYFHSLRFKKSKLPKEEAEQG